MSEESTKIKSPIKALCAGAVGGAVEPTTGQPLWTITRRMQDGHPNPFQLRGMYTGFTANVLSVGPATAVQWAIHAAILPKDAEALPEWRRVVAASSAGFFAGIFVAGPTEQGMTVQQDRSKAALEAGRPKPSFIQANREHGWGRIMSGSVATALRDSWFTTGMFYGAPLISGAIEEWSCDPNLSPAMPTWFPRVAGGASAGALAAIASHPFATIAQEQRGRTNPLGFFQAVKVIAERAGSSPLKVVRAFWTGGIARTTRAAVALVTIPFVAQKTGEAIDWVLQNRK